MLQWPKRNRKQKPEPVPLLIGDIPVPPVTPSPNDAEFAANALLQSFVKQPKPKKKKEIEKGTRTYYQELSEKAHEKHSEEARIAIRYVAFVEHELRKRLPETNWPELEDGLYKHMSIVEHMGGELKSRWQHCLANVTMRMCNAVSEKQEEIDNQPDEVRK